MLTIIEKGEEKVYELSPAQQKKLQEEIIRNQSIIKIKVVDKYKKLSPEKGIITPFIQIHPVGWLMDGGQKKQIRYYESKQFNKDREAYDYLPRSIEFKGQKTIWTKNTSMDLLFFLHYCSEFCEGGEGYNEKKTAMFAIHNPKLRAVEEVKQEKAVIRLKELLFDEQRGLTEKDVKAMAKALFVPEVDNMDDAEVRIAVRNKVVSDKKALERFNLMYSDDKMLEQRTYISDAISVGFIQHVMADGNWYYTDKQGDKTQPIVKVINTSDTGKVDELYEYFRDDKAAWLEFKSFVDKNLYKREEMNLDSTKTEKPRGNPNFGKKNN